MNKKQFASEYAESSYTFQCKTDRIIASLIFKHMKGNSVLDLGCGPTHHVLALLLPDLPQTTAVDILSENLDYLSHCRSKSIITTNQLKAMEYRYEIEGKKYFELQAIENIREMYDRITEISKHDVRQFRERYIEKFDSAFQIGCFGCLDNLHEFTDAIRFTYSYIKYNGNFLMVNWLQDNYEERPYGFNGVLSAQLNKQVYCDTLKEAGFEILEFNETDEISDIAKRFGDTSMIWAVTKKSRK